MFRSNGSLASIKSSYLTDCDKNNFVWLFFRSIVLPGLSEREHNASMFGGVDYKVVAGFVGRMVLLVSAKRRIYWPI